MHSVAAAEVLFFFTLYFPLCWYMSSARVRCTSPLYLAVCKPPTMVLGQARWSYASTLSLQSSPFTNVDLPADWRIHSHSKME